jgi:hypothetical protein
VDFDDPGPDLCVDLSICFSFCLLSVKSKFLSEIDLKQGG